MTQIQNILDGIYFGEQPDWVKLAAEKIQHWSNLSLFVNYSLTISISIIAVSYTHLTLPTSVIV